MSPAPSPEAATVSVPEGENEESAKAAVVSLVTSLSVKSKPGVTRVLLGP